MARHGARARVNSYLFPSLILRRRPPEVHGAACARLRAGATCGLGLGAGPTRAQRRQVARGPSRPCRNLPRHEERRGRPRGARAHTRLEGGQRGDARGTRGCGPRVDHNGRLTCGGPAPVRDPTPRGVRTRDSQRPPSVISCRNIFTPCMVEITPVGSDGRITQTADPKDGGHGEGRAT
jgi:hypothetical protein